MGKHKDLSEFDKLPEYTVQCSLLCMGVPSCRPVRVPMLTLTIMGTCVSELDHKAMVGGGLVE